MSFWTAEDKIPISQSKVSIPAQHGLEYNPSQKCEFHLPAGIGFFNPKESYLNLSVKISDSAVGDPTRLMLDQESGMNILIKDVRVYSGGSGRQILEEYQNYNVLTALKYDYETSDTHRAKRGLTEGVVGHSEKSRSTTPISTLAQTNLNENPYFKPVSATNDYSTAWDGDDQFTTVKGLIPLHTGIFQNDKIFPIALTEGLIVEIVFEEARRVFRTLDQTNAYRNLSANPYFHSSNGDPTGALLPVADNASKFSVFYVSRLNCQGWSKDISAFPFCVGEQIEFVNASTGAVNPSTDTGAADGDPVCKIQQIEYEGGTVNMIKITLDGNYRPTTTFTQNLVMVSRAIETAASYSPSYKISNAEFILEKVEMPEGYTSKLTQMMKGGGAMNYDFMSATNYKISQLANERVANLRLPLNQSRAKSVLCIPTDASASSTKDLLLTKDTYITDYGVGSASGTRAWNANHSQRTGITGCADFLTSYQLFYEGKLNPSRKVFTNKLSGKKSVDAQPLIELEKALTMGGIKPFSMLKFRENFCIGRALSLQNGVYDTRGQDFALQVEYQETTDPVVNKLWNCWCVHLRRIVISGNAISLQV